MKVIKIAVQAPPAPRSGEVWGEAKTDAKRSEEEVESLAGELR